MEHVKIRSHVVRVRGPRQRHHADLKSEPEHNLADRAAVALGNPSQLGMAQHLAVRGKEGKALVNQPVGRAELSHATFPAPGLRDDPRNQPP